LDLDTVADERETIAPRDENEEKLALIWKEILKIDRIGVNDDFFELGGQSLLATQVISRVRNTFRVQMPLAGFLAAPTIANLASAIKECPAMETQEEEMSRLLEQLEGLSEEEAERLLAAELERERPVAE
jgi:acyl carrier protein